MRQVINLDAAARQVENRFPSWRGRGWDVGPMTWADGQTSVNDVTTDRGAVRGDYSVGVKASRGDAEAELVVYAGGWCDLLFWSGRVTDAPIDEAPGWEDWLDLEALGRVLDHFESLILG